MRNRTGIVALAVIALAVIGGASRAQAPVPLDPAVVRALGTHSIGVDDALAALVESLAASTPAYELEIGRLRTDERARFAFFRTVARAFPRILASDQFRDAYARRRADFTRSYSTNPHFAESLERYFPPDPRQLAADGIRTFEAQCGDVNFRAATRVDESGRRRFVDPAYEGRSRMWKLCFRIGARSMNELRRAARSYQAELARAGITPRPPRE